MTRAFFVYPQETWSAAQCGQLAKRRMTDGHGTAGPKGQLIDFGFGAHRFNGGIVREDEYYCAGYIQPFPVLPPGYTIRSNSWGYCIMSLDDAAYIASTNDVPYASMPLNEMVKALAGPDTGSKKTP